jgi:dTDP-4-dehydrorhamnose reductase
MKILVLGSTGMLGSTVTTFLESQGHEVVRTSRSLPNSALQDDSINFDVIKDDLSKLKIVESNYDYIINCVGLIKNLINNSREARELAIRINSIFPVELNKVATASNTKVIHIGTDCVYSGSNGRYSEESTLDPVDVYGYSKALGEFSSENQMLLRCSIVGREKSSHTSLMDWVLKQPPNAEIKGYTNHLWNGVTTLTFAKIVNGIMVRDLFKGGSFHIVPMSEVSKFELVSLFIKNFERGDIQVIPTRAEFDVNRTLSTVHEEISRTFWRAAGYSSLPTHAEMILEYATYVADNVEKEV